MIVKSAPLIISKNPRLLGCVGLVGVDGADLTVMLVFVT